MFAHDPNHAFSEMGVTMKKTKEITSREVLRAFFNSLAVVDEGIRWRRFRFDSRLLGQHLSKLGKVPQDLVDEIANRYCVSILRSDPLKLRICGFERKFDRQTLGESLGAVGVQFFPTRHSANRSAYESGRECAYFGYGPQESQFFGCPIARVSAVLNKAVEVPALGTILRDLREEFAENRTVFEMLSNDAFFGQKLSGFEELSSFQEALRNQPLSKEAEEKCESFFNRHVTIGVRDTLRWMMGSRHPQFNWDHAKLLMNSAFDRYGKSNLNTPQIVYYAYDPSISEDDIEAMLAHNHEVLDAFKQALGKAISLEDSEIYGLISKHLEALAAYILDIHHDYPDFDLESAGRNGATTQIDFWGHSIQNKVNQEFLGNDSETRRNVNFAAHFAARGIEQAYLSALSNAQKERFYSVVDDLVEQYNAAQGVAGVHGVVMYRRIPCVLFMIQDQGNPVVGENERLLDSFDMSQMTELEHASYIRSFPDISQLLLVFFVLTLRHMVDTEHVPDLKPRDLMRDFLVLGLWGTRTPNIRIHLYVDKSQSEKDLATQLSRAELRFFGTEQVETHPLNHIREDAKAVRFAVQHLMPFIEPSILRNIGVFTMALDEFGASSRPFKLDGMSVMRYGVDVWREIMNWGVKGSVHELLTIAEYCADSTFNGVQRGLDEVARRLRKLQKK